MLESEIKNIRHKILQSTEELKDTVTLICKANQMIPDTVPKVIRETKEIISQICELIEPQKKPETTPKKKS